MGQGMLTLSGAPSTTSLIGCCHLSVFIRPSFDGRIMVWRCPSVRSVVHNPCGQDIARTIWPRMLKLSMYT